MKYKVGDLVKIKSKKDLKNNCYFTGPVSMMENHGGTIVKITTIDYTNLPYYCEDWWWKEDWIEKLITPSTNIPEFSLENLVKEKGIVGFSRVVGISIDELDEITYTLSKEGKIVKESELLHVSILNITLKQLKNEI